MKKFNEMNAEELALEVAKQAREVMDDWARRGLPVAMGVSVAALVLGFGCEEIKDLGTPQTYTNTLVESSFKAGRTMWGEELGPRSKDPRLAVPTVETPTKLSPGIVN